jgi:DNA-binding response OmpR family regulator
VAFKGVVVDFGKVEVSRDGISVVLTAHEFKTLQFFVQNPDRLITRAELLKEGCGYGDGYTNSSSIDNHILKLRPKVEYPPSASRAGPNPQKAPDNSVAAPSNDVAATLNDKQITIS